MASRYLRGVDAALRGAALPYGYTLTVWATGASLIRSHGTPDLGHVLLFVAGATTAYGLLKLASHGAAAAGRDIATSSHVFRAGIIHVSGIGFGVGVAAVIARIGAATAWPLASFAATTIYLCLTSVEIALLEAPSSERAGSSVSDL